MRELAASRRQGAAGPPQVDEIEQRVRTFGGIDASAKLLLVLIDMIWKPGL